MARFLVERYLACLSEDELSAEVRRQRDAAEAAQRLGHDIVYIRTTYLPEDETSLTLFDAPDRSQLVEALAAASVDVLRMGQAIEADPVR
jgi:hypothetical protein